MPSWFASDEMRSFDRTYWTQWGIPDEQLYHVAWQRYLAHVHDDAPHLQMLLTISNHHPFSFPSKYGANDHRGGMRYADACLATFIGHFLALPAADRPIIFITADHSVHWNLDDAPPLGADGMEGIRIPGCLLLPDGAAAGSVCDAPMAHQDLLDLLYLLTTPPGAAGQRRFLDLHRIAIPTVIGADHSILTRDGFYHAPSGKCYRLHGRWQLAEDTTPEIDKRLLNAHASIEALSHAMWMGGKP
jgi:arylsulfatase A-like enzyme